MSRGLVPLIGWPPHHEKSPENLDLIELLLAWLTVPSHQGSLVRVGDLEKNDRLVRQAPSVAPPARELC